MINITGFGKFNGVEENPTEVVIRSLVPSDDLKCSVLEVSTEAVNEYICGQLHANLEHQTGKPAHSLNIHFGIDGNATSFRLEEAAYNNMSYRVPDERGNMPSDQVIDSSQALDQPLTTSLPLADMKTALTEAGFSVVIGDDPGRFLCNYIYYESLRQVKANTPMGCTNTSLFVHVPPVVHQSLEVHHAFANALISYCRNFLKECN